MKSLAMHTTCLLTICTLLSNFSVQNTYLMQITGATLTIQTLATPPYHTTAPQGQYTARLFIQNVYSDGCGVWTFVHIMQMCEAVACNCSPV